MTKNQVNAPKSPLLPYEFVKTQRVIAFEKDQQAQVISEQPLSKELFQELYRFLANILNLIHVPRPNLINC
jgi:hypothetical protein